MLPVRRTVAATVVLTGMVVVMTVAFLLILPCSPLLLVMARAGSLVGGAVAVVGMAVPAGTGGFLFCLRLASG